jgi:hypothetical protein
MGILRTRADLFQIGANEVDEVFGEFRGDLLLDAVDEVKSDVGFENLGHEAVDAAADGREQHELASAIIVGRQRALDGVQLATQFAYALRELDGFAFVMGHEVIPLDNTYPGYGIYGVGVALLLPILPPPANAHLPVKAC